MPRPRVTAISPRPPSWKSTEDLVPGLHVLAVIGVGLAYSRSVVLKLENSSEAPSPPAPEFLICRSGGVVLTDL